MRWRYGVVCLTRTSRNLIDFQVLHNNQNVVQQCVPLAELQRELENTNFHSASVMPLAAPAADCNANAALLQAIASLQINTTA